mmetsp:Transcript_14066/g.23394  ORF Transcript_14066/g.23394 Transcript_14066/m.23394 type:complete len:214 (+) Transcript_14066:2527-3168(+)
MLPLYQIPPADPEQISPPAAGSPEELLFSESLGRTVVNVRNDSADNSLTYEQLDLLEANADEPPAGPFRVLLVDDAASNRKMLRRLLTNLGHTCEEAVNGQVAVEMMKRLLPVTNQQQPPSRLVDEEETISTVAAAAAGNFDVIIMDFEMPVLNGPLATKQIRAMGVSTPIVGITGNVLPEDVSYFKSCGADDVLAKPLRTTDLERIWSRIKT